MKVIIVGGGGTIGRAIRAALPKDWSAIIASRSGDVSVDLNDPASISAMYEQSGPVDGVICVAGGAKFGPLNVLSDADFEAGFRNKLMGQANLIRLGQDHLSLGASVTLTSGMLATHPNPNSVALTTFNIAVEGFVRAAALNLEHGHRLNVVRTPMVRETARKMGWGDGGMPAAKVAQLYLSSLLGEQTGAVITP
ncbi:MAG: short chain dehydrogenase [Pseudomonadota bacterium]